MLLAGAWLTTPVHAAPVTLTLDPAETRVSFAVGSTLHLVEGTARLVEGEVRFDSEGGAASGRIAIDARSAQTGNSRRARTLHADVLESERFALIVFVPERVEVLRVSGSEAEVRVAGRLDLHGNVRPIAISAQLRADGGRLAVDARFALPYLEWGVGDPDTFLLKVDDVVNIRVEAKGRVDPPLR